MPIHDDYETVDTVWVRPDDALARAKAGEFDLIFPTMKNLEAISRFATSGELLAAAAAVERVPTVLPRVVADERGFRILLPGDPGYDEAVGEAPDAARGRAMTPSEVGAVVRTIGADGRAERSAIERAASPRARRALPDPVGPWRSRRWSFGSPPPTPAS